MSRNGKPMIAIHGGSGVRDPREMTPDLAAQYRAKLKESLEAGHVVLMKGATSVDAVEAAIRVMEDCPLFNCGKGAAFTAAGTTEMDSSIMYGKTLEAGGVAGITRLRNPITAARLVMEASPHVLMIGEGAETFAEARGLETAPPEYFFTERQWNTLQNRLKNNIKFGQKFSTLSADLDEDDENVSHGTVGCVALDSHGDLAAGTSTGGRVNKHPGRVGDSPLIGAGTYASNESCAVSTTGLGEYHIRILSARETAVLMEHKGMPVQQALDEVIRGKLVRLGGAGGAVAVDREGNVGMSFSGRGMYRGFMAADGSYQVKIYKE
jgi:L-asparaginase / beta-aspartyl-peptidase